MKSIFTHALSFFVLLVTPPVTLGQSAVDYESSSGGAAWTHSVEVWLSHLLPGFSGFLLLLFLASLVCIFLILGTYYFFSRNRDRSSKIDFIREGLFKFRWVLGLLLVTDVFLLSNHLLVRGLAVGIWDVNVAYYPYQVLVADHARAGRFLHWDPWSNGGIPTGGDPQFGAFSPINSLIGLITGGNSSGFMLYWLLLWWLGGLGMMLLARHLQAPAWGGAVVTLGFLFCGIYITHAEHTSLITAYSFLPFVIWRLDVALGTRRGWPAIEAGALWGLSAMAGYPAIIIITGLFAGLWALGRWLCTESADDGADSQTATQERPPDALKTAPRPTLPFVFAALTLVVLVGVLVLAPTYFAFFYEGAGTHNRVGALEREYALSNQTLHPGALSTFSSPFLPVVKIYSPSGKNKGLWPELDVSMCSIYAGAIITVFALLALFRRPRDKWRWWVFGMGLFNLACALGNWLPLRGWIYDLIYPTRFFRQSAIFRAYFIFALAVLALLAMRDLAAALRQPSDRIWRRFVFAALLVACGALLVFRLYVNSPASARLPAPWTHLAYLHAFLVWLGICLVAVVGWVLPQRFKSQAVLGLLLAVAVSDACLTVSVSIVIMADQDPQAIERWDALDARHSDALDLTSHGLQREERELYGDRNYRLNATNDQMITKNLVLNSYVTAINNYHAMMVNNPKLKQMALGAERVWFAQEVAQVAPTGGHFSVFNSRGEILNGFPLLVHSPAEMLRLTEKDMLNPATGQVEQIERLPAAEKVAVKLLKYTPDELIFETECPTDGWLLVTDRWARGWRAEVNGRPSTVYCGNFLFRAVQVTAGLNKISFTYHPTGFPWLLSLSWGMLAAVTLTAIYRGGRGRLRLSSTLYKK